ncbi:hypothetical protein EXV95_18810 [Acidovorax sp. JMULE5]|uniref:hypothetical protein n=1 Tax=Acidovorax sp. JMULE5 TaxID=2518343 RepID=UPI0015A0B649|nr:hypothetical protein [Acidovorax sp. JMULE5]QLA82507.1 hypothetical protein EXV95_18810 [Acidovorax sp. JMULE5]
MKKVTKEDLDRALDAWYVARERAGYEMQAWSILTQSHGSLIASLRENGHSWTQAGAEFATLSGSQQTALLSAWKNMDELCREYQSLLARFKGQQV